MLHIPAKDALVPQCAFQSQEGEGHPEAEPPLLQLINPSLTCIHRDGLSQPGHSAEPRLGGGCQSTGGCHQDSWSAQGSPGPKEKAESIGHEN